MVSYADGRGVSELLSGLRNGKFVIVRIEFGVRE